MSYIRVRLNGSLPGGEVWSVNPAFAESDDVIDWNQEDGQQAADQIGGLALPSALNDLRSVAAAGTTVRVERRSDTHELIGAAEAPWIAAQGSSLGVSKPLQACAVISLRSTVPGASNRGRLYWPALGAIIGTTTARLTAPTVSAAASAAATYLDEINSTLMEYLYPDPSPLTSWLAVVSPTTGVKRRITRVEVGDILDVQRRRRDKVAEVYGSAPMP